jgi:hypothetical protein
VLAPVKEVLVRPKFPRDIIKRNIQRTKPTSIPCSIPKDLKEKPINQAFSKGCFPERKAITPTTDKVKDP